MGEGLDIIAIVQACAGIVVAAIGTCRINQLRWARIVYTAAYIGITVAGVGLAIAAVAPQHDSRWLPAVLLASLALLLFDTRSRWRNGAPSDTGSLT